VDIVVNAEVQVGVAFRFPRQVQIDNEMCAGVMEDLVVHAPPPRVVSAVCHGVTLHPDNAS
jgi:hypothetical protein